jgi:diaminohydroxyphosphoribosylaminopyrimidine deaminase/5-amino-6-(5-phosphoribosylamino)uracil reductase
MVGAVLLRDRVVVGEGYHAEFGGPHAETVALSQVSDPSGATCIVTLEPCAHQGKTSPCTDALIRAGVARVVIAVRDPHPKARGGAAKLRSAGIDVTMGLGREAATALNAPFLFNATDDERPFLAVKLATSLDGFIADESGTSKWVSGPDAREFVQWLRAGFDAIGAGARTVMQDDPQLTVRGPLQPRVPPMRVVFSRTAALRSTLRVLDTAGEIPTTVVVGSASAVQAEKLLVNTGANVLAADTLADALRALKASGVQSLLVEGGGAVVGALLQAGLVNRLYWIQAPIWLGRGTQAFGSRGAVPLPEAPRWTITESRRLGRDSLLVVDERLCLQES